MRDLKQDRRFVPACYRRLILADDRKTGRIVRIVLDRFADDRQSVLQGCLERGDRRCPRLLFGNPCCMGRAGDLNSLGLG